MSLWYSLSIPRLWRSSSLQSLCMHTQWRLLAHTVWLQVRWWTVCLIPRRAWEWDQMLCTPTIHMYSPYLNYQQLDYTPLISLEPKLSIPELPRTHTHTHTHTHTRMHTVGGKECKITLCDMQTGSATHILRSHRRPVLALAWSPHSDHLLASGR